MRNEKIELDSIILPGSGMEVAWIQAYGMIRYSTVSRTALYRIYVGQIPSHADGRPHWCNG